MFYKFIRDGYIIGIGVGSGGEEISETEYNKLLDVIANRPEAPEGYTYRLATAMEWELVEIPKVEPTVEEIIESEEDEE